MAECGVYAGGTAHVLAATMQAYRGEQASKFHLFDTFNGMPDTSVAQRHYHSPGAFGDTSLEQVQGRLHDYPFIQFHRGVIPRSFEDVAEVPLYSFVHIDVDIYPTTLECCKYFWPRLSPGGVMVFDDYGFRPYQYAERAAVDEFFGRVPEKPIYLPTGQAVVTKR